MEKKIERQTLLLRLDGELDMKTADNLRQTIDSEIDRRGIRTVILNLQKSRIYRQLRTRGATRTI